MGNNSFTESVTRVDQGSIFGDAAGAPCLLVAYSKPNTMAVDRCNITELFVIGRDEDCKLSVNDKKTSKHHATIRKIGDDYWIEDMGSTNGTFVSGVRISDPMKLSNCDIIRIGQAVLVYFQDAGALLTITVSDNFGFIGDFHTAPLVKEIRAATLSGLHILFVGPSGAGKELAARALVSMLDDSGTDKPFVVHNAARFSSEEEATTTLFGVAPRVFSNVSARQGLLEQAGGGALFLDETHNLPERVQRTLLRIIEDGQFTRIGETHNRPLNIRFIMASNAPAPTYDLAHDLLARLRVVKIPSLKERAADIPSIFRHFLKLSLGRLEVPFSKVESLLSADHYEAMCLDGFPVDNVRGILELTDRISTYIASDEDPARVMAKVFNERFAGGPVAHRYSGKKAPVQSAPKNDEPQKKDRKPSHYERNKDIIIAVYHKTKGNLSATQRLLQDRGIKCSNRWLAVFLERWGVR